MVKTAHRAFYCRTPLSTSSKKSIQESPMRFFLKVTPSTDPSSSQNPVSRAPTLGKVYSTGLTNPTVLLLAANRSSLMRFRIAPKIGADADVPAVSENPPLAKTAMLSPTAATSGTPRPIRVGRVVVVEEVGHSVPLVVRDGVDVAEAAAGGERVRVAATGGVEGGRFAVRDVLAGVEFGGADVGDVGAGVGPIAYSGIARGVGLLPTVGDGHDVGRFESPAHQRAVVSHRPELILIRVRRVDALGIAGLAVGRVVALIVPVVDVEYRDRLRIHDRIVDRVGIVGDADVRVVGEEEIQVLLVPHLKLRLEDSHAIVRVREAGVIVVSQLDVSMAVRSLLLRFIGGWCRAPVQLNSRSDVVDMMLHMLRYMILLGSREHASCMAILVFEVLALVFRLNMTSNPMVGKPVLNLFAIIR
ncbi:hypothetical protein KC357_g298 [Hortaea werneckii]|nr:hypothetical protein KC357_g298 [Hortaea werneckii]